MAVTSNSNTIGCSVANCWAKFIQAGRLVCLGKAVKSVHTVFARERRADESVSYEAAATTRADRSQP